VTVFEQAFKNIDNVLRKGKGIGRVVAGFHRFPYQPQVGNAAGVQA